MRKVTSVLKKSAPCSSCPPVYAVDGCVDGTYYASQGYSEVLARVIGTGAIFINGGFQSYTSSISYEDAVNNALYEAMRVAFANIGDGNPNFATWPQTRSNTEISYTANCPCGWTGDPVTVTKEAGTFLNYWTVTEANNAAYNEAQSEAVSELDCTEPAL